MLKPLILITALSTTGHAIACNSYASVGAGYKFQEPDTFIVNGQNVDASFGSNPSARLQVGCEYKLSDRSLIDVGISHHSQWFDGWPVNNEPEYYKTEFFIDYKYYFKRK